MGCILTFTCTDVSLIFVCLFKSIHISAVQQPVTILYQLLSVTQTSWKKEFLRRDWKEARVTVSSPVKRQGSGDEQANRFVHKGSISRS